MDVDLCFREYGEYEGNEPDGVTEHWAVVVGCENYKNSRPAKWARNDAKNIASLLVESGWSVTLLLDATSSEAYQALNETADKEDADDVVLFYFSGHGNSHSMSTSDLSVINEFLFKIYFLDKLYTNKTVLILDFCESGGFMSYVQGEGRLILASSMDEESSWSSDNLKSGVFTYYLAQGMKGAADGVNGYEKDGMVSAEEAFAYAAPLTTAYAASRGKSQHPQMYDGVEGEVILTKV